MSRNTSPNTFLEKTFRKNSDIVSREIAGEFILVPIRANAADLESIYTLNETGAVIWQLLDEEDSLGRIKDMIAGSFDASSREIEDDLLEFIEQMQNIGAVEEILS